MYFPIIPLYARMPATWRDKPLKPPPAKQAILGYIEAYDLDVLVRCSTALPAHIAGTGLQVTTPDKIRKTLDDE